MSETESDPNTSAVPNLAEKSELVYQTMYKRFTDWCQENGRERVNESTLVDYFSKVVIKRHQPSSCWSQYSMIKTKLLQYRNINIAEYEKLNTLLRKNAKGFVSKETKVFTKAQIVDFLTTADDVEFLVVKVCLIIGVFAASRRDQLAYLRQRDVKDCGHYMKIRTVDRKTRTPIESTIPKGNEPGLNFVKIIRKYVSLRPPKVPHKRFFVSYREGKCNPQPIGVNTIGTYPQKIAKFLALPNPELFNACSFRKSSKDLLTAFGAPPKKKLQKPVSSTVPRKRTAYEVFHEIKLEPGDFLDENEVEVPSFETRNLRKRSQHKSYMEDPLSGEENTMDSFVKEEIESANEEDPMKESTEEDEEEPPPKNISDAKGETFSLEVGKVPIYFNNLTDCKIIIRKKLD